MQNDNFYWHIISINIHKTLVTSCWDWPKHTIVICMCVHVAYW
jgi:hypothetical protein